MFERESPGMTPEAVSCPYCNARFALPSGGTATARVRCPRCGDSFAHHVAAAEVNGEPQTPLGPSLEPARPLRHSNWQVARLVLGIMAGMAILGLAYAFWTVDFRRQNDRKKEAPGTESVLPGPSATRPADLAGLGYLPADSGLVAGLHLAELLQDAEGRKLWQKLREGPAGAPLKLVEDRTGLKAEQIDHVVVGLHTAQPGAVLVVRTRRPYRPEALAKAMTGAKKETFRAKPVYRFQVGIVGDGLVFQPAADTLILSLSVLSAAKVADLQAFLTQPERGAERLPPVIRDGIRVKLDRQSLLWAVGSVPDLPGLPELVALGGAGLPDDARALLMNLKAFSAGIRFEGGLTLGAALQGKDEPAARQLAALVAKYRPEGAQSYKVVTPPPAAAPQERTWVLLQVRASAATVTGLVDRLAALLPGGA